MRSVLPRGTDVSTVLPTLILLFYVSTTAYALYIDRVLRLPTNCFRTLLASPPTGSLAEPVGGGGIVSVLRLVGLVFLTSHRFHISM